MEKEGKMQRIDLQREFKPFFRPPRYKLAIVEVPPFNYLTIDGEGDLYPSGLTSALDLLARQLYDMVKERSQIDYKFRTYVEEVLWWTEDTVGFEEKWWKQFRWTRLRLLPMEATVEMLEEARQQVRPHAREGKAFLEKIQFETVHEGVCVQVMQFAKIMRGTPKMLGKMRAFAEEQGYQVEGKLHEMPVNMVGRENPKFETVLRRPVKRN